MKKAADVEESSIALKIEDYYPPPKTTIPTGLMVGAISSRETRRVLTIMTKHSSQRTTT